MRTIFKYVLSTIGTSAVEMPEGAVILDVQIQHGLVTAWALCDKTAPLVTRTFTIVGTGWEFGADNLTYLATVRQAPLVWHVFEVKQ